MTLASSGSNGREALQSPNNLHNNDQFSLKIQNSNAFKCRRKLRGGDTISPDNNFLPDGFETSLAFSEV